MFDGGDVGKTRNTSNGLRELQLVLLLIVLAGIGEVFKGSDLIFPLRQEALVTADVGLVKAGGDEPFTKLLKLKRGPSGFQMISTQLAPDGLSVVIMRMFTCLLYTSPSPRDA